MFLVFCAGVVIGAVLHNNRHYFERGSRTLQSTVSEWMLEVKRWTARRHDLRWVMVDVNKGVQGDAHFIQLKNGETILIDTGYRQPASEILIPFLEKQGVSHIYQSRPQRSLWGTGRDR